MNKHGKEHMIPNILKLQNEIITEINNLLDSELPDDVYDSTASIFNNTEISDAIETQVGPPGSNPAHPISPESPKERFILSRLGHASANPTNQEKHNFLRLLQVVIS